MDTCTRSSLASRTFTHPTQGSTPFSATQSLMLCLPFQHYSGCVKKKTSPLDMSVRLLTLGLSYTLNTWKHPLLCYTVPQAMPSLPVLFRVCKEENQPLRSVCEVPSHTRFIKLVRPHFQSQFNTYQSINAYTTIYTISGLRKTLWKQNELLRWVKTTP